MKFNPSKHVDVEMLVNSIIDRINEMCEVEKINKLYEVSIKSDYLKGTISIGGKSKKKTKKTKTLLFTVVDLETRERLSLFSVDYQFKNPAEALTSNYKKRLYKEFLYNMVLGFGFNIESIIRADMAEKALENTINFKDDKVDLSKVL